MRGEKKLGALMPDEMALVLNRALTNAEVAKLTNRPYSSIAWARRVHGVTDYHRTKRGQYNRHSTLGRQSNPRFHTWTKSAIYCETSAQHCQGCDNAKYYGFGLYTGCMMPDSIKRLKDFGVPMPRDTQAWRK